MDEIPDEIKQFVISNISTTDELRILLLLCHSSDKEWDAGIVSSILYTKPGSAVTSLENLKSKGLLAHVGDNQKTYRYAPKDPDVDKMVRQLLELERTHPVTLIKLVYSRPTDVQKFADAFRIRKDPKD